MAFGARLKQARKYRGLTQQQLADAVDWDQGAIGNIERRDSNICSHSAAIASVLNVNLDWLITGVGEMDSLRRETIDCTKIRIDNTSVIPIVSSEELAQVKTYHPNLVAATDSSYQKTDRIKLAGADDFYVFEVVLGSDNMQPTIAPNTAIRVDGSKATYPINNNKIYALVVNGQFMVRRLSTRVDGSILMHSDNSLYKDEVVSSDNFSDFVTILGWVFDWNMTDAW
ncbi:MAG: XRE family transcriptional regulator [Psychrobacter sp.]